LAESNNSVNAGNAIRILHALCEGASTKYVTRDMPNIETHPSGVTHELQWMSRSKHTKEQKLFQPTTPVSRVTHLTDDP